MNPTAWIVLGVAAALGVVLLLAVVGALLPSRYAVAASIRVRSAPEAVWRAVLEPSWQRAGHGAAVRLHAWEDFRRLVYVGDDEAEGGPLRIIVEIEPAGAATRLTITEEGAVVHPVRRALHRAFGRRPIRRRLTRTLRELSVRIMRPRPVLLDRPPRARAQ
jgi:hypothetical protein